jgi:hypothetical protein
MAFSLPLAPAVKTLAPQAVLLRLPKPTALLLPSGSYW